MRGLSQYNDGVNYQLTVISVFSKRLFAVPLKKKSGPEVAAVFEKIFAEASPRCLQTDKGAEFIGADTATKRVFKEHVVTYVTKQNPDVKAAMVERVNRKLKTRMWRYLTNNMWRYFDEQDLVPLYRPVFNRLVDAYNRSLHKNLGGKLRPVDVDSGEWR